MKIGVLGGTFDPPHIGHLTLAETAREVLGLDEVIFLPNNRNPLKHGRSMSPAKSRLAMVQALIDKKEGLAACDLEVVKGGFSYTVESMSDLCAAHPADYWFLLGADALRTFPEWKQPQRLVRLCRLGVVIRPPATMQDAMLHVPEEFRPHIDWVPMKPIDISSTELRKKLGQKQPVAPYLPEPVLQYIKQNHLYQS